MINPFGKVLISAGMQSGRNQAPVPLAGKVGDPAFFLYHHRAPASGISGQRCTTPGPFPSMERRSGV